MPEVSESQLALLSPLKKPDCAQLLNDIKDSLNRASQINLWNRLQHNHFTRYVWWPGSAQDDWSTRKIPQPGQKPPLPWPNAANLKVRLTDGVINDYRDLLDVAESRAMPHILPTQLDMGSDDRMNKASAWGSVYEYYAERCDKELHRARSSWKDIAWEYGHSIAYVGWKRRMGLEKRTLDPETVIKVLAALRLSQSRMEATPDTMAMAEGVAAMELYEADNKALVQILQQIDPEITPKEAARIAPQLAKGKAVDYGVPVVVNEQPEVRALIPGLHVFYPPETTDIQNAQFIVMPMWLSDVQLREKVTTEGWDKAAVEAIISNAMPGRATFFDGISFGTYLAQPINWALTGGMIGMGVQAWDPAGEKNCRQWQLLRVFYRATDPSTGVPVQYETAFHPDMVNKSDGAPEFVFHDWCLNDHAQYPFADYKREEHAPSLWDSRGVGECSYSEQNEMKEAADYLYNNMQISLRPPYEVSSRSELASKDLIPGAKVVTSSNFGQGIKKIDIAGDSKQAQLVTEMSTTRNNNYWKVGTDERMDPIAKQITQQARVNDYMKCSKGFMRLVFATIQQYVPDEVKAGAVNGQPVDLNISRHDIQGEFSVFMEFDVADLDPKAVESRAKMLREMIAPLDNQGLIQIKPVLDLLMLSVFPKFGRQLVTSSNDAAKQQIDLAKKNLLMALNGIEPDYTSGGNPKLRSQVITSILSTPAMEPSGKPVVDEMTGQPLPSRPAMLANQDPTVRSLVENLLKHEDFEAAQQDNVEVGRKGVKQLQPMGQ